MSQKLLPHSPFLPFDPEIMLYERFMGFMAPATFTGPKDEVEAVDRGCSLHAGLNPTTTCRIHGPDALKFLSSICVNGFEKFPINSGRHAIMCNAAGKVIQDGVLIRTGDDDFMTYWLSPYVDYALAKSDFDATAEILTGRVFLHQLSGIRSLETLERAARQDLHDLKFMRWTSATIDGCAVNVLRLGMAGTLSYEIHGRIEDALTVHDALMREGAAFGIRRIAHGAYGMSHTEYGFPQFGIHFVYPWAEDQAFMAHLVAVMDASGAEPLPAMHVRGSAGAEINTRYFSPFELGWDRMVRFDHDFVGRAALEREAADPRRTTVTIEWNQEDILDVIASQFGQDEYRFMDFHHEPNFNFGGITIFNDRVLKDGKEIGISAGRVFSWRYRRMISMGMIDRDQAEIGNEIVVLWGDPGTRQKAIRARVERFPYFRDGRNQTFDTASVPRLANADA